MKQTLVWILTLCVLWPKESIKLKTPQTSCIVITHYQRLLDYIKPDIVHVLYKGRIVKTAGPELALELEERGYDWIKKELGE